MTAFNLADASDVQKVNEFLKNHAYLSGCSLPGKEDAEVLKTFKEPPCLTTYTAAFTWWFALVSFSDSVKEQWGKASTCTKAKTECKKPEKKEEKKDEDELDLFGDDDEETEESKKAAAELKEKLAKKPAKAARIDKSTVVFDVKGYDDTVDLKKIGDWILANISQDGLVWQNEYKLVPHVYGTFKLVITMIIEDAKVSTDDIADKIKEQFEEEVQNVDIAEFNKI